MQTPFQRGTKFAAVVALVSLLSGTGWFFNQPTIQTFSTKVGERSHIQLPDGTRIELTTDTVLRVVTKGQRRKAWLDKGEAFFAVVHDDDHPFELDALNYRIVDLGTEFSVRRDADSIKVMVLKGSVRVGAPSTQIGKNTARLTAGEVVIADAHSLNVTQKAPAEIADALAWRKGVLVFRYTPLSEVVAEFNRYNNEKIVIDDALVSRSVISARLQATDVDAFARMAHDFMGLRIQHSGDEIHISRREE